MTSVRRAPDVTGRTGSAWRMTFQHDHPVIHNVLGAWLVHCPEVHPFWQWWVLTILSLRPTGGWVPEKQYPKAEHELCVVTVDPTKCADPDPEMTMPPPYLEPQDVAFQFDGVSDGAAARIGARCVQAVLAGQLVPDEAFLEGWLRSVGLLVRDERSRSAAN